MVLEKSIVVLQGVSTIVQRPDIVRVDDHVPGAIQACAVTRTDIGDQGRTLRYAGLDKKKSRKDKSQEMAAQHNYHKKFDSGQARIRIVHSLLFSSRPKPAAVPEANRGLRSTSGDSESSESEPGSELKLARRVCAREYSQASVHVGSRVLPIEAVEDIERIRLEHQARALFG